MTERIKDLPHGEVARGTAEFEVLISWVEEVKADAGFRDQAKLGFFQRIRRALMMEGLNMMLKPYGWQLHQGKMVWVGVRQAKPVEPRQLSPLETDAELVRQGIINTGYVIDPQTGRKLPPHERTRWVP